MSRIYALANQKGGVGKTTTAVNVAACLAEAGARVLLVDLDPQANATTGLGHRPVRGRSTYEVLHGVPIADVVIPSGVPNLDLAPSHPDLAAAAVELPDRDDRERVLGNALAEVDADYPFVIVDCPPALGMLTVNALAAANRLIVPVQCEYYALEGLSQLMATIRLVRDRLNPDLEVNGFLLTMLDPRTKLGGDVVREVESHFGDLVYRARVPRSVRLAEAPSHGISIRSYAPGSSGAESYAQAASEFATRVFGSAA